MNAHRSGFVVLLFAVPLLSACADATVPNGVPVIAVDIVPDTATLNLDAPGNTRQFTAVVTRAANDGVIWRSSVPQVATVSGTGMVTAVAIGTTQIIAIAQQDTTKRAAAQVNVVPRLGPTLAITRVVRSGTNILVLPANVQGAIDIVADLQTFANVQRVEFLLDNLVLDGQAGRPNCVRTVASGGAGDFGTGQQAVEIVCTINTAGYAAASGAPTFPNGAHPISVRAVQANGTVVATASSPALTFNNSNFINATLTFLQPGTSTSKECVVAGSNPRSLGGAGSLWCGGDVRVSLTPVNFGGASAAIASATILLRTSGQGVSGAGSCVSNGDASSDRTIASVDRTPAGTGDFPNCAATTIALTDASAANGLSVLFPATLAPPDGVRGIEDMVTFTVNSATVGGQAGPICINPDATTNPVAICGTGTGGGSAPNVAVFANPVRIDNLAPRITLFDLTPPGCETANCFVDGAFAFTTRTGFYSSVDYGADHQDLATFFQAGADVSSLATVTSSATLDNTATATELLLRASARDSLGNRRDVFPTANSAVVATDPAGALRFGVNKGPAASLQRQPLRARPARGTTASGARQDRR
jgi:Big-like domain-containing protein